MFTATDSEIAGHRKTQTLGIVRGIAIRTITLPVPFWGGLKPLMGGRSYCDLAREEAFQAMIKQASRLGANAVTSIRYADGRLIGTAEIVCYGTAAIVQMGETDSPKP